jgi:hypothetical protein
MRSSFVTEVGHLLDNPPGVTLGLEPGTDDEFSDLSDNDLGDQPPDFDDEFDDHPLLQPDELDEKIAELPVADVLVLDEPATQMELAATVPTSPRGADIACTEPRPAPAALAERAKDPRRTKPEKGAEKKNVAGRRMQDAQSFAKNRGPSQKSTPRKNKAGKPA